MKVRCDNPGTKSVTLSKFNRRVDFSPTGLATVPDDIGEYLIRHYPSIEEYEKKAKKPSKQKASPELPKTQINVISEVKAEDLTKEGEK